MEILSKGFLAAIFGIGSYAFFGFIPILENVALLFGVLGFLAAGTYLISRRD